MTLYQFNWLHPIDYIRTERSKVLDIDKINLDDYINWLRENDFGMSDVFTKQLAAEGINVENFFWNDDLYVRQFQNTTSINLFDYRILWKYLTGISIMQLKKIFFLKSVREEELNTIRLFKNFSRTNCGVIFIREPAGLDHRVLKKIKEWYKVKIVCVIGCEFKYITNFDPLVYDAVFTIYPKYYDFFKFINPNTFIFQYGLFNYETTRKFRYDVVFVGDLFHKVQRKKAILMDSVAERYDFKWWGPTNVVKEEFPHLFNAYQGQSAGKAMIEIYAGSKIVVNDYPGNSNGQAVNMRIWEVVSSGAFLLTRDASNLTDLKNKGGLVVFNTDSECLKIIEKLLDDDAQREAIAVKLKRYCYENNNFATNVSQMVAKIKSLMSENMLHPGNPL